MCNVCVCVCVCVCVPSRCLVSGLGVGSGGKAGAGLCARERGRWGAGNQDMLGERVADVRSIMAVAAPRRLPALLLHTHPPPRSPPTHPPACPPPPQPRNLATPDPASNLTGCAPCRLGGPFHGADRRHSAPRGRLHPPHRPHQGLQHGTVRLHHPAGGAGCRPIPLLLPALLLPLLLRPSPLSPIPSAAFLLTAVLGAAATAAAAGRLAGCCFSVSQPPLSRPRPRPFLPCQSALAAFGVARATSTDQLTVPNLFYSLALLALPKLYMCDFFVLAVSSRRYRRYRWHRWERGKAACRWW